MYARVSHVWLSAPPLTVAHQAPWYVKMGTVKDKNGMDPTEDIKKR